MTKKYKNFFLILVIFVLTFALRLYGLNWDQKQHLHPDERFLTMVGSAIKLPESFEQYFNTSTSPLNPYNYKDYQFFVYGTFPLFLTKYIAEFLKLADYSHIHFVGRVLSAIFDSLNIITLYFLSKLIFKQKKTLYLIIPSVFYCFSVLPIQLSHFFAVDTFLTCFILLTFTFLAYFLSTPKIKYLIFSGLFFGLSLASKISAIYFIPIIGIMFLFFLIKKNKSIKFHKKIFFGIIFLFFVFIAFRVFQPYAFTTLFKINPQFIENLKTLQSLGSKTNLFPPSVQWLSQKPIISPIKNIFFWGIGFFPCILIFILFLRNKYLFDKKNIKKITIVKNFIFFSVLFWVIFLFIYQGLQFIIPTRYFLPIYPFIFLLTLFFIDKGGLSLKFLLIILFLHFIYSMMFLSIYSRPHSRVQASEWIYKNIRPNSAITNEYWDDALPLYLKEFNFSYKNEMLHLYDSDTSKKWQIINNILKDTDYILMTSNRLWGSISNVPNQYPITSKFYQDLFDEKLDFKKTIEINSYPGFSLPFLKRCYYFGPTNFPYKTFKNKWFTVDDKCFYPGIYLRDDTADETFTVYDHPKILIFKKQDLFRN